MTTRAKNEAPYFIGSHTYFQELRSDPKHHLWIGDVRLTPAQQDRIADTLEGLVERLERQTLPASVRRVMRAVKAVYNHNGDTHSACEYAKKCDRLHEAWHAHQRAEKRKGVKA
jgi:hypothetical protein